MVLPNKLNNDIWDYCRLNSITDIDAFITKMVRDGFTIERYGYSPESNETPQVVEKEVIKEVEKIVEVSNDEEVSKYLKRIEGLEETILKFKEAYEAPYVPPVPTSIPPPKIVEKDIYGEGARGTFGSNLLD